MEEEADVATYEELAQLEREFDVVDEQIIAQTYLLSAPLYNKRAITVSKIPHFWPLVFEQCPEDIDQYIQPSDSEVLALHLTHFSVTRPDILLPPFTSGAGAGVNGGNGSASTIPKPAGNALGNPRTLTFTFTFSPNPWFHDTTLTKTFTHRRTLIGSSHYTSAPVRIHWKCEVEDYLKNMDFETAELKEDLTGGAGRMACELQGAVDALVASTTTDGGVDAGAGLEGVKSRARELQKQIKNLKEYKALQARVEASSEGSQSFFAWFGYRGRYVGEEEARVAEERWTGGLKDENVDEDEDEEEEDEADLLTEEDLLIEEADDDAEVCPAGEELATVLAEDLWVNALRYFSKCSPCARLPSFHVRWEN